MYFALQDGHELLEVRSGMLWFEYEIPPPLPQPSPHRLMY
jgi:hypothetical protein